MSLSDEIILDKETLISDGVILTCDIREFINELKKGYQDIHPDRLAFDLIPLIDKLAGDKLI